MSTGAVAALSLILLLALIFFGVHLSTSLIYQCAQRIPFHGTFFNSDERAKPVGMGRGPAVYVRRYSAVCLDGTSGELIRRQPGFV